MSTKVKESRKLWNGIELISWIPAIITIIIIWYMSSQTGTVSTDTSAKVTSDIAMRSFFGINLGFLDDPELMDVLHSIVRSCAHIGEYAVLALCVCIACRVCKVRGRFRQIYALMICGIISLSDEMLQVFVPDRYGDLSDIVCDMAGAAFSVIIVTMFERMLNLAASKKKSETAGDGVKVKRLEFTSTPSVDSRTVRNAKLVVDDEEYAATVQNGLVKVAQTITLDKNTTTNFKLVVSLDSNPIVTGGFTYTLTKVEAEDTSSDRNDLTSSYSIA